MPFRRKNISLRRAFSLTFGLFIALTLLWMTSGLVRAYWIEKTVHVFPKNVTAVGWERKEGALRQDLSPKAPFESFGLDNSAFIKLEATSSLPQQITPVAPVATSTPETPVFPPMMLNPELPPTTNEHPPSILFPEQSMILISPEATTSSPEATSTTMSSSTTLVAIPMSGEGVIDTNLLSGRGTSTPVISLPLPIIVQPESTTTDATSTPGKIIAPQSTSTPNGATSTVSSSTTMRMERKTDGLFLENHVIQSVENIASDLLSLTALTAFATSSIVADISMSSDSGNSDPEASSTVASPVVDDVSACVALGTTCHTLTLSGFDVTGELRDKVLKGVVLNFSFGAKLPDAEVSQDKLVVRYYVRGQWRQAGEIYLNKELSNASNGSYFTAKLDAVENWNDVDNMHVVFEFVRQSGKPAELYLDSAWLDTTYKYRAQQILSGTSLDETSNLPENVSTSLSDGGADPSILALAERNVHFDFAGSLSETLVIRADKRFYVSDATTTNDGGYPTTIYTSVTNGGKTKDTFTWLAAFQGAAATMTDLSQYMKNIGTTTQRIIKNNVTYFCDVGWQKITGDRYRCTATNDEHVCVWLNEDKKNCQEADVEVGVDEEITYSSGWVSAPIEPAEGTDRAGLSKIFTPVSKTAKTFEILPGQTLYFKIQLTSSSTSRLNFALQARGLTSSGSLESARLRPVSVLEAQKKAKNGKQKNKEHLERTRLNDQLSDKSDFGSNEVPEFRFKFKTQRGFFTRVKDFVLRNKVPFNVKDARLVRTDGSIEHVPLDIEYGANGDWAMRFESRPRAFRPGKYSVQLSLDEGGQTYTDSLDFYWGVLAINSNKDVYMPDETVHFNMAALNDSGDTVCDANLLLSVAAPSGAQLDVPVQPGFGCGMNNVTDLPDYIADYSGLEEGTTTVTLSRLDEAGNVVNSTTNSFWTALDSPFTIARNGPTRIYPFSKYPMQITVTATRDIEGTISEILPEGFLVPNKGSAALSQADGVVNLTWDISLHAGESKTFSYTFKAPNVSPYVYMLGPVKLTGVDGSVYVEGRTWEIASDAVLIATGVAWLSGTTTSNGTEWNNTTAAAINWTTDDYDSTYYSHSTTTNNSRLTVNQAGDYLVAVTVPTERTDTANAVEALEANVYVNGVPQAYAIGRSNSTNRNTQRSSANHIAVLLHNLAVNDYIEVYSRTVSGGTATNHIVVSTQASMYVEYMPATETIFSAIATTTNGGTNMSPVATSSMTWYDIGSRVDSGYTHGNGSTSQNITLSAQGDYVVYINIPVEESTAVANSRGRGRVLLNGVMINGGDFKQDYISNSNGHVASSMHWSGVVHSTTTNSVLSVSVQQATASAAATMTVGSSQASIYVQKLPSTDVFFSRATTTATVAPGTDWNPTATGTILWAADDIKDATTFSHTVGKATTTVLKAGDYFLVYNDSISNNSGTARTAPRVTVMINGSPVSGALAPEHFTRVAGGATDTESSGSLVFLLRNLAANDQITVRTVANTVTGTNVADQDALLLLWRKVPQSAFTQNTYKWYWNKDAITPDDPWPAGTASDLNEGDPITTGNAATSSSPLRIRMAVQVSTTTTAFADQFKLQYATGSTCAASLTWTDVGATSSASIWRGYDNPSVAEYTTLPSHILTVSNVNESYVESNPSTTTPNGMTVNQNGEWDWAIQDNAAPPGTSYCFRMVHSNGQLLKDYLDYPKLITNNSPTAPTLSKLFDNEKSTSTTPWFEFLSSDENGDDINYSIQISTDPTFATTNIVTDSNTNLNDFEDISDTADKKPFTSGQVIRYKVPVASALTNGTTYYWRVAAIDPFGTNIYSATSSLRSFTIDNTLTATAWFQTKAQQFNTDILSQVESTSTDDVGLSAGQTTGTITTPEIDFSLAIIGNAWGTVTTTQSTLFGTLLYQIQYFTSTSSWANVPDTDLTGNGAGFTTLPITLTSLDPITYNALRIFGTFTKTTATPRLFDWTLSWALAVSRPTLSKLFDNEKSATTTPQLEFAATDPQGQDLTYQVQWSTDSTFATGVTTRTSDTDAGFSNVTNTGDTQPYSSGNTVQLWIRTADALTNGTTYWWRVRAKDPVPGANAYSTWSTARSFTIDTSVTVSTWFQTTTAQFQGDTLSRVTATGNSVTGVTDTGKIAVYRAATAGETIPTTGASFFHTWDTPVRQDNIFSTTTRSNINLKTGYYAVMYNARFNSSAGTNRSEMQSFLTLASTSLPIGWSQAFIRRSGTATQGFASAGGIINVSSDDQQLNLETFRSDVNTTAGVTRVAGLAGIELIRLDSAWSYLRLSKTTTQVGPTSAAWTPVTYNGEDQVDSTDFSHTSGSASVTLKSTGHYLVFANTYGSLASGTSIDTTVDQKITLGGKDVIGSFTTVYMTGNTNAEGAYQGAASVGMIIESTTTNQILTVQVSRSSGTASWTINANQAGTYVNRTALSIVKIPEGDFMRLTNSATQNLNPAAQTALSWNTEPEKDTASFTHSTVTNPSRLSAAQAGDYLFFAGSYYHPRPTTLANSNMSQGWTQNGGALATYGVGGHFNSTINTGTGGFVSFLYPGMTAGQYIETVVQGLNVTTTAFNATSTAIQGVRIASLTENDPVPQTVTSNDIVFTDGTGPKWSSISFNVTKPGTTNVKFQVYYLSATSTYSLVPDGQFTGGSWNSTGGTTTGPIDISGLNRTTYGTLRVKATLTCAAGSCPTVDDWTVNWSLGYSVSGTALQSNLTSSTTAGTVGVAVNGVLQSGKTGTIAANGTWTIPNVTFFANDIITVFVSTTTPSAKAVGVTKTTGTSNVTGITLNAEHLTLGSDENPTITNADIGLYDNGVGGANIIDDVDAGNDLTTCAISACSSGGGFATAGASYTGLVIKSGTTYRPASAGGITVTTKDIQIDGTLIADGNTLYVGGSWKNTNTFTKNTSSVVLTGTTTTYTIDSSTASSSAFQNLTFGQTSGTATWNLLSALNASGTVSLNFGTLGQNGANAINLGGDLTIGSSGIWTKGTASTTFNGSTSNVWTDNSAAKQDLGTVVIDGSAKTVTLGSNVRATDVTIGADDTLSLGSTFTFNVGGNWTNNNVFSAQTGTVNFTSTVTGKTIKPGISSFYNLTFNGVGGNWSFSTPTTTVANDFTITNGTVTLPTATTTVGGSFDSSAGTFTHNNGTVLFNSSASGKTINPGASSFYDLAFNGSGSWSFGSANATSSRSTVITAGTLTAPSATLAIGGSFAKNGGSFTHNSGTLKFTAATANTIRLNNSDAANLWFNGAGSWSFIDTSATTTANVTITSGTVTAPSSTFAIGGSYDASTGTFTHNSGTVKFVATATGKTVTPGQNNFFNLIFDGVSGGWTISANATSTASTTIANASSFTLSANTWLDVGGNFVNQVGGSATTFTNSLLTLHSGGTQTINSKTTGGDTYGTIFVGANTNIRMWNSNAATTTPNATGSMYSQNNAAVSGDLYIAGRYIARGNEYWSYVTDFDGTALGGSSRQANVRLASSTVFVSATGTLQMLGTATATTTIANQGAGEYSFMITGTVNAQYYQVRNTDSSGVVITGVPIITSLANGDFQLGRNGITMMTVGPEAINANPAYIIQVDKFATSSGVSTGFNVTATGTPTTYWWFRNHYGNRAGEAYDSDPGGDPGNIRWEDSNFSITVSGTVYSGEGSGVSSVCDNSTPVVKIVASGGAFATGSCASGTGAYTIPGVTFVGDATLTAYLDTNGGRRAVTVTRTPSGNVTGLDLYEGALIVRHEGVSPLSITNLAERDSTYDSDIPFRASTTTTPNVATTTPDTELFVWTGKTFAPGGNIVLQSGTTTARDGLLHLAANSVFTAAGTESHSIGGGLKVDSGATFTPANSTLIFTATTTGKSILAAQPLSLWNVNFSGSGAWSFDSAGSATTTIQNSLAINAGTVVGTGDVIVQTGGVSGNGTVAMTNGTVVLQGTGSFGNSSLWQFFNLILGDGASTATQTKSSTGTTTVTHVLNVATNETLQAGSSPWVLSGSGSPFLINGTFTVQTAAFWYTATAATTIKNATYAALYLAPSGAGAPTYTFGGGGGSVFTTNMTVGGANAVTVNADTNDPSISVTGDVSILSGSTLIASNVGAFQVAGSWTNAGTFTASGGAVTFNATATGKFVNPGSSSFYDLVFDGPSGGWTVTNNATSTHNTSLTNAGAFTVSPNVTLAVSGTFTNAVGGASTTLSNSYLFLNSGTNYTLNTKTTGADTYGNLVLGPSTAIRMWNSSAGTTTVNATASLYSQNHAAVSGDLYVWGAYARSSGSEYWSYDTDFDGTTLSGGSRRQVNVRVASSSSVTFSGGVFNVIGTSTASTTIQVQGSGAYAMAISGGTFDSSFYVFRNLDPNGLNISGTPIINSLSNGDFELAASGGTLITVASTVIDKVENQLKTWKSVRFATSTGVASGFNVTETGTLTVSPNFWKFNLHYGNLAGESFDNDPAGDPGYVRWDDSAGAVTISGRVFSDEGTSVSSVCDNSTQVVRLKVQGAGVYSGFCNSSTGVYSIPNIQYNPGDVLTLYLDSNGGRRGATISRDPTASIGDMDIYENRVIVRHQSSTPINIADLDQYDHGQDTDIPFVATVGGTNTLVLEPNTKLIVWAGKTFAPAGNITIQSGGVNVWDGSLELYATSTLSLAGSQSHSIGGSLAVAAGATIQPANSTFTFTATTTGKTINSFASSFYNLSFNGVGGNWSFSTSSVTVSNDFTIATGTVTLATATTTVGASFLGAGGAFLHNNGTVLLTSTASGKSITASSSPFYNLTLNGSGGAWSFIDTSATTSNNFTVSAGSVTLPKNVFAVGGSFDSAGTFTHNNGTVKLTSVATGKTIRSSGSNFYSLQCNGLGGAWTFLDTSATTTRDFTISNGSTTIPAGVLAVGGSFTNGGTFNNNSGTMKFTATTTGFTIAASSSPFYNLVFDATAGGWTISSDATSTHDVSLTNAASFTLASGKTLAVGGTFTNSVGGAPTTWSGSILSLYSATGYSINTKSAGGDAYGAINIGASTNIRMWNSSGSPITAASSASLYSQNNAGVSGDLYIYGAYTRSSGIDYWSYATDFDGTALGGSSRQANVRIASSSSIVYSGGTFNMLGTASASTTVQNQGTGRYSFAVSAGIFNANYYQFRNLDANGLTISGTPAITSLSYGDYELDVPASGTLITLAPASVDANASLVITGNRFATSTGVNTGFNVRLTSTSTTSWTFTNHYGNFAGEAHDSDSYNACGNILWDDSVCALQKQAHYRFRNDDGGEGATAAEWYNVSWSHRKKVAISNANATSYTNLAVKVVINYDSAMQADFDDLRFTSSNGTTSLPFWRETTVNSASTTVWVKVPTLSANSSATIYAYFGNGSAVAADDGASTFKFFEDFEDNDVSDYTGGNSAAFSTSASFNHNGTYGLTAAASRDYMYRTGSLMAKGDTISFYQYVNSSVDDEPCTLFGANGAALNYAVCLDQFPSDNVIIVKNTTSNDGAAGASTLSSTPITYTSGGHWYHVLVDWLTTNAINVSVYDDSETVAASLSATDSTHSSGGPGFGYFVQTGGWDTYSVKAYTAVAPTSLFGSKQASGGATWAGLEDTVVAGILPLTNVRLRFSVQNSGTSLTGQQYRLQYASKGASLNCESVPAINYNDVPVKGSCGGADVCMDSSAQFTSLASTSPSLSYPATMNFASGYMISSSTNQSNAMSLAANTATEVEYNFRFTNTASQSVYCLRTTNGGLDLDTYDHVAQATLSFPPQISNFSLNNAQDITLTEGATTTIYATSTVTDFNGYADMTSATGTIYRSGVANGAGCTANDNSCYQVASTSCTFNSCSGNSCTLACRADIQYVADATDVGSVFPSENWLARIQVKDSTGFNTVATSFGVELNTLYALAVTTGTIDFGSITVGQNSGTTVATSTIQNTGNAGIDIQVSGTNLTDGANTIAVGEQKYATSTFQYGSCSICQFLTGSATNVDLNIPKPAATTTQSTSTVYWGINIPNGTAATLHTGINTFIAVGQ